MRRLLLLETFAIIILLPQWGAADPYLVKADATGANNGTSWANAFTDLQTALGAVQWGDEIWVAAGTYKPIRGTDRNKSFMLVAGVGLYGGFAGTETAREERDWNAHETILSGDIGTTGTNTDNAYRVVTGESLAVLDGFTVTDGYGSNGGGMYNNSITSLTVTNCSFLGNRADGDGGGMFNYESSVRVANCVFRSNVNGGTGYTGGGGGGMYNYNSRATVDNCTFSSNTSAYGGGGIYNNAMYSYPSPSVSNCTFIGNSGGGLVSDKSADVPVDSSQFKVTNCVFSGNTGAGLRIGSGSAVVTGCSFRGNSGSGLSNAGDLVVTQCVFSRNTSSGTGGGLRNVGPSLTVAYCIFTGNVASYQSSSGGGGGIYTENHLDHGDSITNCVFSGNSGGSGGGLWNLAGTPAITNCIFTNNVATINFGIGGGMYNEYGSPKLIHCTFRGNVAANNGGGIHNYGGATIINSVFWDNTGGSDPSGVGITNYGLATYRHCNIQGCNGSGVHWISALGTDGGGNIMADPCFVDPSLPGGPDGVWMTEDDGLRLRWVSPCINAGDPNGAAAVDILGNPRVSQPDIGAYEYNTPLPSGVAQWTIYH